MMIFFKMSCFLTFSSSNVKFRPNTQTMNVLSISGWEITSSLEWQMSDALPDRQTEIKINQYPCHWIKSTSSSHVLRGVCSRLLISSGGTPLTPEPLPGIVLMQIRRGTNSSSHNSIRHLHIEHLHPMKIGQYLPAHPPLPPQPLAPQDPRGRLGPCSPTASRLPLLSPPDPVRPGYNTWPRPRDGPIGVQGKCLFLVVCLRAALPGLCPVLVR